MGVESGQGIAFQVHLLEGRAPVVGVDGGSRQSAEPDDDRQVIGPGGCVAAKDGFGSFECDLMSESFNQTQTERN